MRSWIPVKLQLIIVFCAMIFLTGCTANLPKLTSGDMEIGLGISRQVTVLKHPTDGDFVPSASVGICKHF